MMDNLNVDEEISDDEIHFGKITIKEIKKMFCIRPPSKTCDDTVYDPSTSVKLIETHSQPNLRSRTEICAGFLSTPGSPALDRNSDDSFIQMENLVTKLCISSRDSDTEELNNTLDVIDYILNNGPNHKIVQEGKKNEEIDVVNADSKVTSPLKPTCPEACLPLKNSPEVCSPYKNRSPEASSPLKNNSPEVCSPMKVNSPEACSPLKTNSPEACLPLKTCSPKMCSPLETNSPIVCSPLKTKIPKVCSPLKTDIPEVCSALKTDSPKVCSPLKTDSPKVCSPLKTDKPKVCSPLKTNIPKVCLALKTDSPKVCSLFKTIRPKVCSPLKTDSPRVCSPLKTDSPKVCSQFKTIRPKVCLQLETNSPKVCLPLETNSPKVCSSSKINSPEQRSPLETTGTKKEHTQAKQTYLLTEKTDSRNPPNYYTPAQAIMKHNFLTPTKHIKVNTPVFKTPANASSAKKPLTPRNTPGKTLAYQHIASPVASYINNCPQVPLVKTVLPKKPLPGPSSIPKFVRNLSQSKISVNKENMKLPSVAYKSAKITKVIKVPDEEKLPHTPWAMKITSSVPKPTVLKHENREMNLVNKRLLYQQEDSFGNLSCQQADVSVVTEKTAFKSANKH